MTTDEFLDFCDTPEGSAILDAEFKALTPDEVNHFRNVGLAVYRHAFNHTAAAVRAAFYNGVLGSAGPVYVVEAARGAYRLMQGGQEIGAALDRLLLAEAIDAALAEITDEEDAFRDVYAQRFDRAPEIIGQFRAVADQLQGDEPASHAGLLEHVKGSATWAERVGPERKRIPRLSTRYGGRNGKAWWSKEHWRIKARYAWPKR
jgi:hypothetical protein